MHERGWLQGLAGRFVGHLVRGELAQFVINQRQQLIGGRGMAALDGLEQLRQFGHVQDATIETSSCR